MDNLWDPSCDKSYFPHFQNIDWIYHHILAQKIFGLCLSFAKNKILNHDPKRERKLLLSKKQINTLIGRINQEGMTIVPTKMYFYKGKAKIQVAVGKGKKLYDKRLGLNKND